jgi:hypothetical protein
MVGIAALNLNTTGDHAHMVGDTTATVIAITATITAAVAALSEVFLRYLVR